MANSHRGHPVAILALDLILDLILAEAALDLAGPRGGRRLGTL